MHRLQMLLTVLATTLLGALLVAGCSSGDTDESAPAGAAADTDAPAEDQSGGTATRQRFDLSMTFTSPVFNAKRRIPKLHTCIGGKVDRSGQSDKVGEMFARSSLTPTDAQNLSPPLAWSGAPEGTQSFALILHSREAQASDEPWIHWVIWNLPPDVTELAEGVEEAETLANGARQGLNSGGEVGYLGPCPPPLISRHASVPGGGKNPKQEIEKYFFEVYALDAKLDLAAGATRDQLLEAMDGHVLAAGELVGERQGPLKLQLSPGGV